MLYNQTAVAAEYAGRISVTDKKVTLHSVRMSDEGSYIVLDREGKIRRRNCLNVRGEREGFCFAPADIDRGKKRAGRFASPRPSVMSPD